MKKLVFDINREPPTHVQIEAARADIPFNSLAAAMVFSVYAPACLLLAVITVDPVYLYGFVGCVIIVFFAWMRFEDWYQTCRIVTPEDYPQLEALFDASPEGKRYSDCVMRQQRGFVYGDFAVIKEAADKAFARRSLKSLYSLRD